MITSGAIIICKHPNTATGPTQIIKKSVEGDIIGFDEGDGGLTANPLTWFMAFQDGTEVVFLELDAFRDLWKLHSKMFEQMIVLKDLDSNESFRQLDKTTKYMLVFEHM